MKTVFRAVLIALIAISVLLVVAVPLVNHFYEGDQAAVELAVSINLIWGYVLFAIAILGAIASFIVSVITSPNGSRTLASLGIGFGVILVVVAAVLLPNFDFETMSSNFAQIPNSAGGAFDDQIALGVANVSLITTYIVAAVALVLVVASLIQRVFSK